jgi:AcrR family transcriptional regulator
MAYRHHLPPPPTYDDAPGWRGNSYDVGSRLVRTAWNMLFTHEPADISIREVAHEVGVSQPAAYNHFADRNRLFSELAWGGLVTMAAELGELWDLELQKGSVPGICRVWLRFAQKRPRHYTLMFSREFNDPKRDPIVVEKRNNLRAFLRVVAETELGFAPPPAEADVLFAVLHGAASLVASGDPKLPPKVVPQAIAGHLASLKKRRTR